MVDAYKMDFIRKPEVLATANAVGTASIYFILSKRLNALTEEVDEIDNHLSSSIKKISDNSRSIQGITETFKEVLTRFEEHRKNITNFTRTFKKLEDDIGDLNDRYDALLVAVKDLGGTVDLRKAKKKKKKSKDRTNESRYTTESSNSESDSERDKKSSKQKENKQSSNQSSSERKQSKEDDNSDEDFIKKTQQALKK
jgi:chromosome segregation ATPase